MTAAAAAADPAAAVPPYTTWNWIARVGYDVAQEAYHYDLQLRGRGEPSRPVYAAGAAGAAPTEVDLTFEEDAQAKRAALFRATYGSTHKLRRRTLAVDSVKFTYSSASSCDQTAAYTGALDGQQPVLVLGFRGSDTTDPMRWLNFVPHDLDALVQAEFRAYQDAVRRHGKRAPQWEDVPDFAPSYQPDCLLTAAPESPAAGAPLTRRYFVAKALRKFANLGGRIASLPYSVPVHTLPRKDDELFGYLQGGGDCNAPLIWRACRAAAHSDFVADVNIAKGALDGDAKHAAARAWARAQYDAWLRAAMRTAAATAGSPIRPIVIVAGHSLGGSLACSAFCALMDAVESQALLWAGPHAACAAPRVHFVGFNAAQLANHNNALASVFARAPEAQQRVIHFRNDNDAVSDALASASSGDKIPMLTYIRKGQLLNASHYSTGSDSLTHSLWTFSTCPAAVAWYFVPQQAQYTRRDCQGACQIDSVPELRHFAQPHGPAPRMQQRQAQKQHQQQQQQHHHQQQQQQKQKHARTGSPGRAARKASRA